MRTQNFHASSLLWMIVVILNICTSVTKDVDDDNGNYGWERYKMKYRKKYDNATVERIRQTNRLRTLKIIEKHNRNAFANGTGSTFFLRENALCDMTDEEYASMLGFRSGRSFSPHSTNRSEGRSGRYRRAWQKPQIYYNTIDVSLLPSCVNWTAKGWVGPVLFQGLCGSCWSYTTVGALQAQYYNVTGKFVQLSTQNLIDCSYPQGNQGCNGGNMQRAFIYVAQYGIESLDAYPDISRITGTAGTCKYNASLSMTTINSYRDVDYGNELALQQAVALTGPVAVGIDASSKAFQTYGGGVYTDSSCGSDVSQLNHAVLVVGYGVYNNQSYWLIQNSWGTGWGINGYMMLARDANNLCGIATDATFPIIGWKSTPPTKPVSGSVDCVGESMPSRTSVTASSALSLLACSPLVTTISLSHFLIEMLLLIDC